MHVTSRDRMTLEVRLHHTCGADAWLLLLPARATGCACIIIDTCISRQINDASGVTPGFAHAGMSMPVQCLLRWQGGMFVQDSATLQATGWGRYWVSPASCGI